MNDTTFAAVGTAEGTPPWAALYVRYLQKAAELGHAKAREELGFD